MKALSIVVMLVMMVGIMTPILSAHASPAVIIQTAHGVHGTIDGTPAVSLLFASTPTIGNLLLFGIASDASTDNSPTVDSLCSEPSNICSTFSILHGSNGNAQLQVGCAGGEICDSEVWFGFITSSDKNYTAFMSDISIISDMFGLEVSGAQIDNNPFTSHQGGGGDCNLVSSPLAESSFNALVFAVASTSGAGSSWSINDAKFTLVGSTENAGNAVYATTYASDTIPTTTAIHNPTASTCGTMTVSLREVSTTTITSYPTSIIPEQILMALVVLIIVYALVAKSIKGGIGSLSKEYRA